MNDFQTLRNEMHNELARRSKTIPADTYTTNPAAGISVFKEHYQKVLDDVNSGFSQGLTVSPAVTNPYKTVTEEVILTSNITNAILYIQRLMSQTVGKP